MLKNKRNATALYKIAGGYIFFFANLLKEFWGGKNSEFPIHKHDGTRI